MRSAIPKLAAFIDDAAPVASSRPEVVAVAASVVGLARDVSVADDGVSGAGVTLASGAVVLMTDSGTAAGATDGDLGVDAGGATAAGLDPTAGATNVDLGVDAAGATAAALDPTEGANTAGTIDAEGTTVAGLELTTGAAGDDLLPGLGIGVLAGTLGGVIMSVFAGVELT
ncbi:MAG: hypothetical protein M1818_007243 [Claussenomyces sp. TS43310]|nr:MAG: hypothetical protein M1818_007243 [Claussenomyces sp. TS43310]